MDRHSALDPLHPLGDGTRVLVQPNDGVLPLLELIGNAERSVWIKQFTFTHPALLDAVIAAHQRWPRRQGHDQPAPVVRRSGQRCALRHARGGRHQGAMEQPEFRRHPREVDGDRRPAGA